MLLLKNSFILIVAIKYIIKSRMYKIIILERLFQVFKKCLKIILYALFTIHSLLILLADISHPEILYSQQ